MKHWHASLLGLELTARSLDSFSISQPSITDAVKLLDWKESD
jgi:hypothetical protein